MHSNIHPFIYSSICSPIRPSTPPFTSSFIHAFTHSFIRSFTQTLIAFIRSFIHFPIHQCLCHAPPCSMNNSVNNSFIVFHSFHFLPFFEHEPPIFLDDYKSTQAFDLSHPFKKFYLISTFIDQPYLYLDIAQILDRLITGYVMIHHFIFPCIHPPIHPSFYPSVRFHSERCVT